jgi:hypothetical protein
MQRAAIFLQQGMKHIFLRICILSLIPALQAQYPPRAGAVGSTALHVDSVQWSGWATLGTIIRGPMDITQPALGFVTAGSVEAVYGRATENGVVSLGDGGSVTLLFDPPIMDGPGFDFAVFENGFLFRDSLDFLELAFVEVSSDGDYFVRFPAVSITPNLFQSNPFDGLVASHIHNLAGKYTVGYGTPFNLQDLQNDTQINLQSISHIRIVDVVGNIDELYASKDAAGNIINDPWPTPYPTGGFDLDAVGVIHQNISNIIASDAHNDLKIYPNPAISGSILSIPDNGNMYIMNLTGSYVGHLQCEQGKANLPDALSPGIYIISNHDKSKYSRICITN